MYNHVIYISSSLERHQEDVVREGEKERERGGIESVCVCVYLPSVGLFKTHCCW